MPINFRSWTTKAGVLRERWDLEYYVEGKRKQETFESEQAALDREAEVRTDKRRGTYLDPRGGRMLVRAYYEEWLESKNFEPGTRMQVELRMETHVLPVLGPLQLGRTKATTIRGWMNKMKGAESSRAVIFTHVSDLFSCAVDDQLISTNPCKVDTVHRQRPRTPKRVVKEVWEPEQVNAEHDALPDKYSILVPIGARLGLRQGEMFGLAPGDIDFLRGIVHVQRQVKRLPNGKLVFDLPKYGKTREVPLSDGARDYLAAYLARYPAVEVTLPWKDPDQGKPTTVELIVTTATGLAVEASRFSTEVWRPALGRAGIEWVPRKTGCHMLRHYCASVWLAMGYSEVDVATWLGHADPAFTLRTYTHFVRRPDDATRQRLVEEYHTGQRINGESVANRATRKGA